MKKSMSTLAFAIVVLLAPAAYAQSAPLTREAFSYDAAKPLGVRILHQSHEGTLTIQEITFASPNGGDIHAQLVFPRNRTNRGGALFVHWLGDPKTTNLTEFHRDAISVAQHGSVAMLIDAMWAQPHWFMRIRTTDTDYARSIQQVVDLRRSLDVLLSRPGIVPNRIAYVGHDFGAMYGAVLSGIDDRVRWYVLMAGNNTFAEWYLLGKQPADKAAFVASMQPLEPLQYIASSKAAEFLFQFADKDEFITPEHALEFANAAPYPHGMFVYKTDHSLAVPEAFLDRISWLNARLNPSGAVLP